MGQPDAARPRVACLPPSRKDGATTRKLLEAAGFECILCATLAELRAEAEEGADALIVSEEALEHDDLTQLTEMLRRQPAWSDLPILALTYPGARSPRASLAVERLGNVTLLNRPVFSSALLSAVRSAVRTRRRQYETRRYLIEKSEVEERLREADRRKDQFLAMLGHELRNPLAGIVGAADAMSACELTEDAREMHGVMRRQAMFMSRIVDDLLDVSRIATGKLKLTTERIDLRDVITDVAFDYRTSRLDAEDRLLSALPAEPVVVDGDRARLAQVFVNLIYNGCKFSDRIDIAVELSVDRGRGQAVATVIDRGIGMSPSTLRSLFEPFVQADNSVQRSRGGLGLGLALVRGLVELHGGEVSASSPGLGRGSRFEVRLPLAIAKKPDAIASDGEAPRIKRLVLLVDDRRDAILPVQRLLERDGHEVHTANDAISGIERALELRPEALLCDIGLPGAFSGYDVIRTLRGASSTAEVYAVAVTGYGHDEDRSRARDAGFDWHAAKPLGIDKLRELMSRMPRFETVDGRK